jgi:Spy/CpxP family protein refolding chaperone
MDRAGWHYPPGEIRVSDADRDQALSELRVARQLGRITADEFDERASQALASRTGQQLTALLADLPVERGNLPAERPTPTSTVADRSDRFLATRIAIGASAVGAAVFALAAASSVAIQGPSLEQQEFIRQQIASQGMQVPPGLPPTQSTDWAGPIALGTIAVLLIVLAACLSVQLARRDRA